MQGLLAMLMALSVFLLVAMLFITHNSLDSAVVRGDSDQQRQWMAQQFSRIHSSQLRLEERLQAIDGRLDGLVSNGEPQASQPLLAQPASTAANTVAPERGLRRPSAAKEGRAKRHARGSASAAGCQGERRPYHVLLTAQDSLYQAWQTRIMYYHYQRQRAADPCGEVGGFTRMLNSATGRPDALMDEIPTVLVDQLTPGSGCRDGGDTCDFGFPVMNRPHGVAQLLAKIARGEVPRIVEDYLLITETDHVFLRPLPNRATPERPVCYPFGYMKAEAPELRPIVSRYGFDPSVVDPCGPSPVLIHLPLLRRLTPGWLRLSFALKRDDEASRVFGWVLEMWGYTLAAAQLGVRHEVMEQLQQEPSSLWHTELDGEPYIYHYTFGLEFTPDGLSAHT